MKGEAAIAFDAAEADSDVVIVSLFECLSRYLKFDAQSLWIPPSDEGAP